LDASYTSVDTDIAAAPFRFVVRINIIDGRMDINLTNNRMAIYSRIFSKYAYPSYLWIIFPCDVQKYKLLYSTIESLFEDS
jgi:hypothetical protein